MTRKYNEYLIDSSNILPWSENKMNNTNMANVIDDINYLFIAMGALSLQSMVFFAFMFQFYVGFQITGQLHYI